MSFYIEIENIEEFNFYTQYSDICVVDFYTSWCGPCKKLAELLKTKMLDNNKYKKLLFEQQSELSKNDIDDKLVFIKVNIEKIPDFTEKFNINAIPYIIFYKNGELYYDSVKGMNLNSVIEIIDNLINLI